MLHLLPNSDSHSSHARPMIQGSMIQSPSIKVPTTIRNQGQSDFFLLDSNVWLSEEEKAELKKHQMKSSSVEHTPNLITIDLLGRRVLLQGSDMPMEGPSHLSANILT
jgi:hypothetical protein